MSERMRDLAKVTKLGQNSDKSLTQVASLQSRGF